MPALERQLLFCGWNLPNYGPRLTQLHVGKYIVMYFGHQFLFLPHTLGDICYNPKIPYLCIHGIGLPTCIIFQFIVEELYLKNHFLEHVRALLHYCPRKYVCYMIESLRTYACFTLNIPCIPPKVAKIKKLQGIRWNLRAIGGFPTISPDIARPQTE
jgi:hypothetical protein